MSIQQKLQSFGAPAPETLAFNRGLEETLRGAPAPWTVDLDAMRRLRAEGKSVLPIDGPLPEGRWEPAAGVGSGRVRVIEHPAPKGVYLHIHGGGWTLSAPEQFDGRNLMLSRATEVTVVSAEYRLAPENKWPACADDCEGAALKAIELAGDLPLLIGGESAGAHLSAVTLLRLRARGLLERFRGAVLSYGAFDLRATPSVRNWGDTNLVLSTPIIAWFSENLLEGAGDPSDPAVSPLLADLDGMPPALFCVGDQDPLIDDTLFMAERWRAAGAEAELRVWPGGVHAFDYFYAPKYELPIALELHEAMADFVRARL